MKRMKKLPSIDNNTIESGKDIIFLRSPKVILPEGIIESFLSVPELIIHKSAFTV